MGLPTFLTQLYLQIIGGTAPSGAASASGDISQMVKYVANGNVAAYQGAQKVQGSGYLLVPAAAAGIDPANSGIAWTSGAWSEVVASTSEADYLLGIVFGWNSTAATFDESEIDVGKGGSGSEVVIMTVGAGSTAGNVFVVMFPYPVAVASASRLAVRVRSTHTSRQPNNIKLVYCKQTDLVAL